MSDNRYEIYRVVDFLNVPEDRLKDCLDEFVDFLSIARPIVDLADAMSEVLGAKNSTEGTKFTWIDDGKKDRQVLIKTLVATAKEPTG